jgi:hypothetical protein
MLCITPRYLLIVPGREALAARDASRRDQLDPPVVNPLRRDRLKRQLAEVGEQSPLHDPAVVGDRRGAALAVVLDVAQPLARRLGEGDRAGEAGLAGDPVAPGVGEDRVELALGALLGQVALCWPPSPRPRLAKDGLVWPSPSRHFAIQRSPDFRFRRKTWPLIGASRKTTEDELMPPR